MSTTTRSLPIPLVLLLLLLTTSFAEYTMVFTGYWIDYSNQCEATCLTNVFNQQQCQLANNCSVYMGQDCLTLDYTCLCGHSSWLNATSYCIGQSCGAAAVREAAGIATGECKDAGVPMALSEDEIVQAGLAALPPGSATTTAPPAAGTTTSPASPTDTPPSQHSSGGLSTKMQVIIGVVTSIVGVVVAIVGVFFAYKTYKHGKIAAHAHTDSSQHHDPEARSSTTPLAALGEPPARASMSEEGHAQESTAPSLPSPQAVAAALRRVDS